MQIPLKITMRHIAQSEELETRIRKRASKLDDFHPDVIGCAVTVDEQRVHHQRGHFYNVRVAVRIPDHEVVVNRDSDEDPCVALRDAFDAVTRRLGDLARIQRGEVKAHLSGLV